MSVPSPIPELEEGENKDLIETFRKGQLGPIEQVQLFELIYTLQDKYKKKFKIREVLKSSFDYADFDVKRLEGEYNKWKKRNEKNDSTPNPQGPAPPAIMEKAKQIGVGATKALLGETQELGNILVLEYGQKAALRGKGLKDYVIECVQMREQFGDRWEALEQENEELRAFCSILVSVVNPQFKTLAASRIYQDWQIALLNAEAAGITINQDWADEVTAKLERVLGIPKMMVTR